MLAMVPSGLAEVQTEALKLLADYVYVSYTGSLPQWQAFLQRRDLRPAVFDHIKLQYEFGKDLRFDSPRLQFDSAGIVPIGPQSSLDLRMTYMMDRGKITWDVGGLELKPDRDKKTFIAAFRQPKPGEEAGKQLRDRWDHMPKQRRGVRRQGPARQRPHRLLDPHRGPRGRSGGVTRSGRSTSSSTTSTARCCPRRPRRSRASSPAASRSPSRLKRAAKPACITHCPPLRSACASWPG